MSESPLPPLYDDDDEPVTGILEVPRGMRPWAESQSRKTKALGRAVASVDRKLSAFLTRHETERGLLKSLPTVIAVLALLLSALAGYVHLASASPPPQINAEDIAKQIVKLQGTH